MAYDGKIMRRALRRFEEDRQAREARFQARREEIFLRQPRLRRLSQLRSTMSRIIVGALRRARTLFRRWAAAGREYEPAIGAADAAAELGLPEDALEETPLCALCGDTGYRQGRVCRCLERYYTQEQQKELSRMLDLGSQSFDTFSWTGTPTGWSRETASPREAIWRWSTTAARSLPTSSAAAPETCFCLETQGLERPTSPLPSPGRSAPPGGPWCTIRRGMSSPSLRTRSSAGRRMQQTWSGC